MKIESQPVTKNLIAQHYLTDDKSILTSIRKRGGERPLKTLL